MMVILQFVCHHYFDLSLNYSDVYPYVIHNIYKSLEIVQLKGQMYFCVLITSHIGHCFCTESRIRQWFPIHTRATDRTHNLIIIFIKFVDTCIRTLEKKQTIILQQIQNSQAVTTSKFIKSMGSIFVILLNLFKLVVFVCLQ